MSKKKPTYTVILTANNSLQNKAGSGGIPSITIKKCQTFLDNNGIDFIPVAESILDRLYTLIEKAQQKEQQQSTYYEKILECVMQLKANGKMFQYPLITTLGELVMEHLEQNPTLPERTLIVLGKFCEILTTILQNKLTAVSAQQEKRYRKQITDLYNP